MKVIELISKLINGEEVPNKIKYDNAIWEYSKDSNDYYSQEWLIVSYLGRIELSEFINDEIELIEEEKKIELPEKFEIPEIEHKDNQRILSAEIKINGLIDYLKYKEEEKEK